jgi:hypothetical protein
VAFVSAGAALAPAAVLAEGAVVSAGVVAATAGDAGLDGPLTDAAL